MYFALLVIGLCLIGYAYGNVMWAVILGKTKHIDIRTMGSKNPGATNLTRNTNKGLGIAATLLDITKSAIPMVLYIIFIHYVNYDRIGQVRDNLLHKGTHYYRDCFILLPGIAAYFGHCFPVNYLINLKSQDASQYSGGKGVAVFGGIMIVLSPYLALIGIALWLIITYSSKYVSLASVITPVVMTCLSFVNVLYVTQEYNFYQDHLTSDSLNTWSNTIVFGLLWFLAIMILIRHHKNLSNLANHKENKIGSKKKNLNNSKKVELITPKHHKTISAPIVHSHHKKTHPTLITHKHHKKIELLAPAGDLYRGKIALDYGADAVYLGGKYYSLRARASNFDFKAIKEISEYAHAKKRKWYLVVNIVNQNDTIEDFSNFLKKVIVYKPDAYIVSDPYIIETIKTIDSKAKIHISTQQSVTNSKAALFYKRNGANRIILGREVAFNELKLLLNNVKNKIDIEIFIHGAICIAYSGKCELSSSYCLRDANVGGCAQCCRWEYTLSDGKKILSKKFTMSSKDMSLLPKIKELSKLNIKSFKIEGRMKTEHYVATVVNAYKKVMKSLHV